MAKKVFHYLLIIIQKNRYKPYKSTGVWRYFDYEKSTSTATCLKDNCFKKIKISKMSPKEPTNHLKSRSHKMSNDEITGIKKANQITNFTVKKTIETMEDTILKLVALSNISMNKIATDETIR